MSVMCAEVVNLKISMGYYNLISEIVQDEIKYIQGYKSIINDYFKKTLNFQVSAGSKLAKLPDNFANAKWIDSSPILKLTQQIPKIIQIQIENIKNFLDEIEKPLKGLDDYFKEKASEIKKSQSKYDEINNDLISKYKEQVTIEENFLNSINKSEEMIIKYYDNRKKIEEAKKSNLNLKDNELKILNDKDKEYEAQKKCQIKSTKKHETEYKNIIKNIVKCENKFIPIVIESTNVIKKVAGEISEKLKDIILNFLSLIKDSFKIPLNIINDNLNYMKDLNQKDIIIKTMESTFNYEQKLLNRTATRYSLKSLGIIKQNSSNRYSEGSKGSKGSKKSKNKINIEDNNFSEKGMIKFEDGFEEMSYFEDDMALSTVKEMFENFDLINHNGLNIKLEEEKNQAKTLINKFISNMSNDTYNNKINDDNNIISFDDEKPLTDEEKNNLKSLLKKHHNRVIFLHKLNDYRTLSLFELKRKEYQIIGEFFSSMINESIKEKDFHSIEMAIILSKTYYLLENGKKLYIQNLLKNKDYFKDINFWQQLLIYSISKEVIRSKKSNENGININSNTINENNENIIFSQILSLIDNMSDFGIEGEMIKQIIEPELDYYKINDNLKSTINEVIDTKIKSDKKD